MSTRPLIGITADLDPTRLTLRRDYVRAVEAAGGLALVMPPVPANAAAWVIRCDGILFTGGDDPVMEGFGVATDPRAHRLDPDRQAFELALFAELERRRPETPVLGVCLGMQLMALHHGGTLDQYLSDRLSTAADHLDNRAHLISGDLGTGTVTSHHRQAVSAPGRLVVAARAHDGVIEAIRDPARPFMLGVQWHPERTEDPRFGAALFANFIDAARSEV